MEHSDGGMVGFVAVAAPGLSKSLASASVIACGCGLSVKFQ